jgi:pimeloyl-ACP methyl ester carboxylesterase
MELAIDLSTSREGPTARITVARERVLSKRLQDLEINLPDISFSIPLGDQQAPFRGVIRADSMTGTASLGNGSLRILLRRSGPGLQPPYDEEEVQFANGDVQLFGSLLIPPTRGPHPAIVLIHGSSTPDRDDFRFYADLFVRNGVAALIYDKRSTGGQPGGMSQVDLRDLAGDVVAAVSFLRGRNEIDPDRIGLWGHSQGGWVAPIAATQADSVAFVVGFSAPGVTYAELDKYANATRLRASGFSQDDVDQALAALTRVDDFVRNGGDPGLQSFLDSMHQNRWASFTTLPRIAPTPEHIQSWLRWRNLDLDPADYWRDIHVPVLLAYGELDDVVPVESSADRIRDALDEAGNSQVTIRIFRGENHSISNSQEFLDVMVRWVVERTRP